MPCRSGEKRGSSDPVSILLILKVFMYAITYRHSDIKNSCYRLDYPTQEFFVISLYSYRLEIHIEPSY